MKDAEIEETVFEIANGNYLFLTKGEIITFKGHLIVTGIGEDFNHLPNLQEKEQLKLIHLDPKQNFTKPPARYTEASLVKILEEKGIGRPSTYAAIIDTLGKREYVKMEEKKFFPTFLGEKVTGYLDDNFNDIMQYDFTANLEKQLDLVSEGKLDWVEGIDEFYKKLMIDIEKVAASGKENLKVGRNCPLCQHELVQKYSHKTSGWFIGCQNYPTCKYTEKIKQVEGAIKQDEPLDELCPLCQKPLIKRYSKKTRTYFIGCSGYPECSYVKKEESQPLGECPQCGKPLTKRFSRRTKRYFVGCSGYPDCTYIGKG
jgi:DNA topoisomerase-1